MLLAGPLTPVKPLGVSSMTCVGELLPDSVSNRNWPFERFSTRKAATRKRRSTIKFVSIPSLIARAASASIGFSILVSLPRYTTASITFSSSVAVLSRISAIKIVIFPASAFVFFAGTRRNPPSQPSSSALSTSFSSSLPLLRVPTFRYCTSAGIPSWHFSWFADYWLAGLTYHPSCELSTIDMAMTRAPSAVQPGSKLPFSHQRPIE